MPNPRHVLAYLAFGRHVERALEIAALITRNAPLGIRAMKEAALKYIETGEAAGMVSIPTIRERVIATAAAREGIQSFVERREALFKGL